VHGIRGICNLLQARHNNTSGAQPRTIVWLMLREEPLIFVNGRSVVLRERAEPFHNMGVFRGITPERIEDLEWRLKHDVVAEAAHYNGNIIMHEEVTRREVELTWEATSMESVSTPSEIFAKLRMEGYHIRYERVPLTPEQPPGRSFMDQLLRCVLNTPPDTAFVFNCHTGMVYIDIKMDTCLYIYIHIYVCTYTLAYICMCMLCIITSRLCVTDDLYMYKLDRYIYIDIITYINIHVYMYVCVY
jgi:hypothetical protein